MSKGKLVLFGGGSEHYGNWSDAPFKWGISQAKNKKVAIISFQLSSDWMPTYMVSLGALKAENITINAKELADSKAVYDLLMSYDMLFFKGGDQYKYFKYYQGTLLSDAVNDKFKEGGVIAGTSAGMSILGEILFTAEKGIVYPEEMLENPFNKYATFNHHFISILPNIILDSHFVERGRFARMMGFLQFYKEQHGRDITGIGIDDRTALCIDEKGNAQVMGSAAIGVFEWNKSSLANKLAPQQTEGTGLISEPILFHQLVNGDSFSIDDTGSIKTEPLKTTKSIVKAFHQNFNKEIFLSGSHHIDKNKACINKIATLQPRNILVVTGSNEHLTRTWIEELQKISPQISTINTYTQVKTALDKWSTFDCCIFLNNEVLYFNNYLNAHEDGHQLRSLIYDSDCPLFFIGPDAQFAGDYVLEENEHDPLYNYYGEYQYQEGLSLLEGFAIISNTFDEDTADYYENNTAAIPHALVNHGLAYGLWITADTFVTCKIEDDILQLYATGNYPLILMQHTASEVKNATEKVVGNMYPRDITAFIGMNLQAGFNFNFEIEAPERILYASTSENSEQPNSTNAETEESNIDLYPQPAYHSLVLNYHSPAYIISIIDRDGTVMMEKESHEPTVIDVSNINSGSYLCVIKDQHHNIELKQKIDILH